MIKIILPKRIREAAREPVGAGLLADYLKAPGHAGDRTRRPSFCLIAHIRPRFLSKLNLTISPLAGPNLAG
jgi:hypothetical protein